MGGTVIQATVGFIVFGVHKDGLKDPMGTPFVDDALVRRAKSALVAAGLKVIEHDVVVASKDEARTAFKKMKCDDAIDAVVLFSGTWVWAAHLVGAIRDYCASGKGLLVWTHPGSQGWRPVGGLVLHGGLLEIGVAHKFVYGGLEEPDTGGDGDYELRSQQAAVLFYLLRVGCRNRAVRSNHCNLAYQHFHSFLQAPYSPAATPPKRWPRPGTQPPEDFITCRRRPDNAARNCRPRTDREPPPVT